MTVISKNALFDKRTQNKIYETKKKHIEAPGFLKFLSYILSTTRQADFLQDKHTCYKRKIYKFLVL